jgi:glycosyltransferase involved in cell wall biosynthesis
LLAAKSLGVRVVMMNESHAGTARSGQLGTWIKRRLVAMFKSALVGGQPQKRYFSSLGLPPEKIVTGYDAVDNDYFAGKTAEAKAQAPALRAQYGLPEHYFLNLGRFVAKKNLETLIRAYRLFLDSSKRKETHLVLVGSGEEEGKLRQLCDEVGLPKYDHPPGGSSPTASNAPGVHFYGFRQIEENPVFYGLADAFILPSLYEEWGLVVNEAMACGLPVIVTQTAGCAEDLLEPGFPGETLNGEAAAIQKLRLVSQVRRNGFVFDPETAEELSRILSCLAENPKMRAVMGGESRRIVEKFSCQNFARNAIRAARLAIE